jgi:hypothetical protein
MRSPVAAVAFDASHHGEPLLLAHQRARQARGRADPEAACVPFADGAGWYRGGVGGSLEGLDLEEMAMCEPCGIVADARGCGGERLCRGSRILSLARASMQRTWL